MAVGGTSSSTFLLGLASGLTLLPLTAYRNVTPGWLKWLLWAGGLLLLARYLLIAGRVNVEAAYAFIQVIGFAVPGVIALDQLIRHPNMTPKKLAVTWCLPLIVVAGATCWWPRIAIIVGRLIGAGLMGMCFFLSWKIPVPTLRRTMLILGLAYGLWAVAHVLLSELPLLLALWYAYDTASS